MWMNNVTNGLMKKQEGQNVVPDNAPKTGACADNLALAALDDRARDLLSLCCQTCGAGGMLESI